MGRRIATLASDQTTEPGRHALHEDDRVAGDGLALSGVFFVRVRAGRDQQTRSLVLLRYPVQAAGTKVKRRLWTYQFWCC